MIRWGTRRVVVAFLVLLTLIVFVRVLSSARGATADRDLSKQPVAAGTADRARLALAPFARSRVALYDPSGLAAAALADLGLRFETSRAYQGLARYEGELIVVGPGAFSRGREDLGPILAARARSGMRILLLDQPTLPGTLSDALRLWPSFDPDSVTGVLIEAHHPILRGLPEDEGVSYFARAPLGARPLLPPTRGNFRILAEARADSGPSSQEGVALLELPIGDGVLLAVQAPLCSDPRKDPRSRLVLSGALAYLLGARPPRARAFLYAAGPQALPPCLRDLAPTARPVPPDLQSADLIIAPADWQAANDRAAARPRPLADVARFLHEGGTLLLLDPQPLVGDFLALMTGCQVYFEAREAAAPADNRASPLLLGIDARDLGLLARPGRAELRLRPLPGPEGVEPLLVAPGLAAYRVGRGRLLTLTLPEAAACAAPRVSSLLARILTNAGVPLDPASMPDPQTLSRLDVPTGR